MAEELRNGFQLLDWQVYPLRNVLVGPSGEVRIEPKAMQLLERLARSAGDVVGRDELLDDLWQGRAVTDEPLTRCVATLRRELDDSAKEPRYIQTIPKRGYRLVCPVQPLDTAPTGEPTATSPVPAKRRRTYAALITVAIALVVTGFVAFQWLPMDATQAPNITVAGPETPQPPRRSIAVLPFANLSPESHNDYLSDGLATELMDLLTDVPDLKVAARTSAFAFKGQNIDASEIARQLRVAYVLTGTVRQSGIVLRISAQLIDAGDGYQVWSDTWESELRDIFEIQDEIAIAVVDTLKFELLGGAPTTQRADPEAYALYLQAIDAYRRTAEPNIGDDPTDRQEEAQSLITHALAIDPGYAPAWSLLATIQFSAAQWTTDADATEAYARARASAERALDIDAGLASALRTLGHIDVLWNWDTESAANWYRRALLAKPGDAFTLDAIGLLFGRLGLPAPAYVRDVQNTDPLNPHRYINQALAYWKERRPELARAELEVARSLAPDAVRLRSIEALFDYLDGDYAKAARLSENLHPGVSACSLHALGRIDEAQAILDKLSREDEYGNFAVAQIATCMGDRDAAFNALESAYLVHDQRMGWLNTYLLLQPLSGDPRWDALLESVGIAESDAEKVLGVFADTNL